MEIEERIRLLEKDHIPWSLFEEITGIPSKHHPRIEELLNTWVEIYHGEFAKIYIKKEGKPVQNGCVSRRYWYKFLSFYDLMTVREAAFKFYLTSESFLKLIRVMGEKKVFSPHCGLSSTQLGLIEDMFVLEHGHNTINTVWFFGGIRQPGNLETPEEEVEALTKIFSRIEFEPEFLVDAYTGKTANFFDIITNDPITKNDAVWMYFQGNELSHQEMCSKHTLAKYYNLLMPHVSPYTQIKLDKEFLKIQEQYSFTGGIQGGCVSPGSDSIE